MLSASKILYNCLFKTFLGETLKLNNGNQLYPLWQCNVKSQSNCCLLYEISAQSAIMSHLTSFCNFSVEIMRRQKFSASREIFSKSQVVTQSRLTSYIKSYRKVIATKIHADISIGYLVYNLLS